MRFFSTRCFPSAGLLLLLLMVAHCADADAQSPGRPGAKTKTPTASAQAPPVDRVVLLMLDGVRRREFFRGPNARRLEQSLADEKVRLKEAREKALAAGEKFTEPPPRANIAPGPHSMPLFETRHGPSGLVYGRPSGKVSFWLANSVIYSLPAYRSIFSGYPGNCFSNNCGRIDMETFPERIVRELRLDRHKSAAIASWIKMDFAVTRGGKRIFVNTGTNLFPEFSSAFAAANDGMVAEPPEWGQARLDKFTFAHAMNYLREKNPRFLYISLNDADEWAHLDMYAEYVRTLRRYDTWIDELIRAIDAMPGRTVLLMTTDHDRGSGRYFKNHGYLVDAAPIWFYARGPRGAKVSLNIKNVEGRDFFSHLDIRPTVEALLGLKPRACALCGRPLKAVLKLARGK